MKNVCKLIRKPIIIMTLKPFWRLSSVLGLKCKMSSNEISHKSGKYEIITTLYGVCHAQQWSRDKPGESPIDDRPRGWASEEKPWGETQRPEKKARMRQAQLIRMFNQNSIFTKCLLSAQKSGSQNLWKSKFRRRLQWFPRSHQIHVLSSVFALFRFKTLLSE